MMGSKLTTANGVDCVAADLVQPARRSWSRAVVVVNSGWIFAGDVEDVGGRIKITRALWVFGWQRVGFAAVVAKPLRKEVDLRPIPEGVDLPDFSEIFRVPVSDDWGIE